MKLRELVSVRTHFVTKHNKIYAAFGKFSQGNFAEIYFMFYFETLIYFIRVEFFTSKLVVLLSSLY